MAKNSQSRVPELREHSIYLWLRTELHTLIDNALAVSTQYDWVNNEDEKKAIFEIMERDIQNISNHVAKAPPIKGKE